jgi:hypothetical protein
MVNITDILDDIMNDADISDATIRLLINKTIDNIGLEVVYFGEKAKLSWAHLECYFTSRLAKGDDLHHNLHAHILSAFKETTKVEKLPNIKLVKLTFINPQTAQAFFDFIIHIAPFINTEYPKLNNNEVQLTDDQYYFSYRRSHFKSGKLSTSLLDNFFLKTLRADAFDFSYSFILGLIPDEQNRKRHLNLRPTARRSFTITAEGTVVSRTAKQPMYTRDEKQGYSQIQSCTLIDRKALSPAFGFTKGRQSKLYGLMTHLDDIRLNRLLIEDRGTVCRPFDQPIIQNGEHHASLLKDPRLPVLFSPQEIEHFKTRILRSKRKDDKTNEVLARLRFNPYCSMVSICSNTLESRLLAYDFSEELLEHFVAYVENNGIKVNPKFKIPIIFYLQNSDSFGTSLLNSVKGNEVTRHNLSYYHASMRAEDEKMSQLIYLDEHLRHENYKSLNYEFLLGLERLTCEMLLESIDQVPLALAMMRNGYTRLLIRLLRPTRQNQTFLAPQDSQLSLCTLVFQSLIEHHWISENDPIISQLILIEAFELADEVIKQSGSQKDRLPFGNDTLVNHLIYSGNPRQLNFMGLDKQLIRAAEKNIWVSVSLCLKEYRHINETTLDKLFSLACNQQQYAEVIVLLKKGAGFIESVQNEIFLAVKAEDWILVEILIKHYQHSEDNLMLGKVLLECLHKGQLKLAKLILSLGTTATWRAKEGHGYEFQSTLLYAIGHCFTELYSELLEHEQSHQDDYYQARLRLALDKAYALGVTKAIALLKNIVDTTTLIDPHNIKTSICRLVLEALIAKEPFVAEQRLIRMTHHYHLLAQDNDNVIEGLRILSDEYEGALGTFQHLTLSNLIDLFDSLLIMMLNHKDMSFLKPLLDYISPAAQRATTEHIIIFKAFDRLYPANLAMIQEMLNFSDHKALWESSINQELKTLIAGKNYNPKTARLFILSASILPRLLDHTFTIADLLLAFQHAVYTSDKTLADALLNDSRFKESDKDKLLIFAITFSSSRFFGFLMGHYQFNITLDHILQATHCASEWKLSSLLQAAHREKHYRHYPQWGLFSTWACISLGSYTASCIAFIEARKSLIAMVEPRIIRHFTLTNLLLYLRILFNGHPWGQWSNLDAVFRLGAVLQSIELTSNSCRNFKRPPEDSTDQYLEILNMLNQYFNGTEKIPEEPIVTTTYNKVLDSLKIAAPTHLLSHFFKSRYEGHFNYEMRQYLENVDASVNQAALSTRHSPEEPSVNDQIDVFFNYQSLH